MGQVTEAICAAIKKYTHKMPDQSGVEHDIYICIRMFPLPLIHQSSGPICSTHSEEHNITAVLIELLLFCEQYRMATTSYSDWSQGFVFILM